MNWYLKRTAQAVLTVITVISITFVLVRLMPGGPMDRLRAQMMQSGDPQDVQRVNNLVEVYTNVNPDEPIAVQYVSYIAAILRGDFGTSIQHGDPVAEILGAAIPWTVFLMSIALFLTFTIGIGLGALMAYYEGGRFDVVTSMVSIFLNSVPYYVAAVVMLYVLAYQFGLFPTGGRVDPSIDAGFNLIFFQSVFYHAALPIASLVITGFGMQALAMRGNSIRVLGEDYLRVARLRGLPESEIAINYVGRNAILPMYTGFMISLGFMFGGSIILEEIFTYPGVGYYMFQAIDWRDYPLMMGAFMLITIAVVIGVYIADLTYGKLDPRADHGGGSQ